MQYLKVLLNWRKGSEVILHGRLIQFIPQDGIYVYSRYLDDEAVVVIINKNKENKQLDLVRFQEVLKNFKSGKDIFSGKSFSFEESIALPPETALILELGR